MAQWWAVTVCLSCEILSGVAAHHHLAQGQALEVGSESGLAFNMEAGRPPLIASIWRILTRVGANISLPCRRALTHRSVKKLFQTNKKTSLELLASLQGPKGKREGASYLWWSKVWRPPSAQGSWVLPCSSCSWPQSRGGLCDTVRVRLQPHDQPRSGRAHLCSCYSVTCSCESDAWTLTFPSIHLPQALSHVSRPLSRPSAHSRAPAWMRPCCGWDTGWSAETRLSAS